MESDGKDGLLKLWKEALKEEDCVAVKELLKDNEELLTEEWTEVKSLEAKDSAGVRVWKGRTALHIAARRGDADLVKLIGRILHPKNGQCRTQCHLLEVIDSDYELDALAMAVVNGNQAIVNLLKQVSRDCRWNPFHIRHGKVVPDKDCAEKTEDKTRDLEDLEDITKEILENITKDGGRKRIEERKFMEEQYRKDCDYNFLAMNLFLFHFTFSIWKTDATDKLILDIRKRIFEKAKDKRRLGCLLELQDGQGRTPLHVAVDSNRVEEFLTLIPFGDSNEEFLNTKDGAGRTPLYRAAAKNQFLSVETLLKRDRVDLKRMTTFKLDPDLDLDKLSKRNRFKSSCVFVPEEKLQWKTFNNENNSQGGPGPNIKHLHEISSTALHVAIILKHRKVVQLIVDRMVKNLDDKSEGTDWCSRQFTWPVEAAWRGAEVTYAEYSVSTMKLAVLVGSIPVLQILLENEKQEKRLFTDCEIDLPSFHLAAALGNPGIIKAFLDSEVVKFDDLDCYRNTALHHALKGKDIKFYPHLVDLVGCNHVFHWQWENYEYISEWLTNPDAITKFSRAEERIDNNKELKDRHGKRVGSINLLLEAGIDIWAKNEFGRTASPEADAADDFVKWWYEKVAEEMQNLQGTLNAAANAISVTAALVATASYVGPLQPPLGYDGDSVQGDVASVRVFVVCNTLSFYLALAAIMLALLPSLPLPKESMFREMVRTRILVAVAVSFLFPSIACVLVAFAASSIAVVPDHGLAYHGLTLATSAVGGFLCLIVMTICFNRLVRVYDDVCVEMGKFLQLFLSSLKGHFSKVCGCR